MQFIKDSFYLLDNGTIGQARYTGLFWVVDMTLYRTKAQLVAEGLGVTKDFKTYKGTKYYYNGDFYPVGESRVLSKLNNRSVL